ncbi:MAG: twin-arginine translocation signal domain-containing protein [Actinobacteria bacterium]|nr:twin-arginine translocation signal domain-containing protein [Actinomycetota bacterium]
MTPTPRRDFLKALGLGGAAVAFGTAFSPAVRSTAESAVARIAGGDTTGLLQLARVWPTPGTSRLLDGFDDTHNVFDDGSVELLLWPGDEQRLRATGMRFEVTERDLIARDAALFGDGRGVRPLGLAPQPGETADGTYRDLAQHNADMQQLAATYPLLCELFELPEKSLQGRTIYGLEIAEDVARKDGRPVFYNDGIHHSREWPAAEVPIMWAYDLLEAYARVEAGEAGTTESSSELDDLRLHHLVRTTRNLVVPVVNVDGYDYSRTGPAGTGRDVFDSSFTGINPLAGMQYWRKNMRSAAKALNTGTESGIPQNGVLPTTPGAVGVDNNRNYSYRWGGDGSSGSMISQTYRGDLPFSEPESRNVRALHERYQCVAGITHHTSGNLVLWAWGDTHDDAPDDVLLARLGFACGDYVKYRPTKSIDLYVTTGTCSDWMYGTFGSVSYTFEHAGNSFHPPYLEVVPQFYANNRRAFMLMAELICLEPEQRDLMKQALDHDLDRVTRNGIDSLRTHLFGSFSEQLSGTDYAYDASSALSMDGRYNCVVTGRLVDAAGNGVKGTVRNSKQFANPLVPGNPAGYDEEPAMWDSVIETADDGTFRWTVYPSTAPAKEFAGTLEAVTITAATGGGGEVTRQVTLSRGEVADLGDLTVA